MGRKRTRGEKLEREKIRKMKEQKWMHEGDEDKRKKKIENMERTKENLSMERIGEGGVG